MRIGVAGDTICLLFSITGRTELVAWLAVICGAEMVSIADARIPNTVRTFLTAGTLIRLWAAASRTSRVAVDLPTRVWLTFKPGVTCAGGRANPVFQTCVGEARGAVVFLRPTAAATVYITLCAVLWWAEVLVLADAHIVRVFISVQPTVDAVMLAVTRAGFTAAVARLTLALVFVEEVVLHTSTLPINLRRVGYTGDTVSRCCPSTAIAKRVADIGDTVVCWAIVCPETLAFCRELTIVFRPRVGKAGHTSVLPCAVTGVAVGVTCLTLLRCAKVMSWTGAGAIAWINGRSKALRTVRWLCSIALPTSLITLLTVVC
jgi:hypothetical protein